MSHPKPICYAPRMSRFALAAAVLALGVAVTAGACSKSKDSAQKGASGESPVMAGEPVAPLPGSRGGLQPMEGIGAAPGAGAAGDAFKLQPAEGTLAIDVPAATSGAEVTATVVVTPGAGFHVNMEYPTKLTLTATSGVAIAKAELKAGGADKSKGDAEAFTEDKLVFAIKLTPGASGSHTINGTFKFAVCDKDQCLPKKETIAIQVAAK